MAEINVLFTIILIKFSFHRLLKLIVAMNIILLLLKMKMLMSIVVFVFGVKKIY